MTSDQTEGRRKRWWATCYLVLTMMRVLVMPTVNRTEELQIKLPVNVNAIVLIICWPLLMWTDRWAERWWRDVRRERHWYWTVVMTVTGRDVQQWLMPDDARRDAWALMFWWYERTVEAWRTGEPAGWRRFSYLQKTVTMAARSVQRWLAWQWRKPYGNGKLLFWLVALPSRKPLKHCDPAAIAVPLPAIAVTETLCRRQENGWRYCYWPDWLSKRLAAAWLAERLTGNGWNITVKP